MKRYNLSKIKINYRNINAWWKELEKYIMSMVKFISSKNQRLTIVFTGNTLSHRKQSWKGAEDFIVGKIACHQHATVPKMNSPPPPGLPRNHNRFAKTKIYKEAPLNKNLLRIEAKKNKK